jgi:hypothetical protein
MARLLLYFGFGFLAADAWAIAAQLRYWHRRRTALLTWPARRPPFFRMQLAIGAALACLFAYNLLVRSGAVEQTFGLGAMLLYYAYVVPMSTRIERGFYRDGVWGDRRFIRYGRIGGLAWREAEEPELLLALRDGATAARLSVPGHFYGEARRVLRDLIAQHTIRLADTGLHLGFKDEREDV